MSSVGRGFSPILALHRFLKWCGERGGGLSIYVFANRLPGMVSTVLKMLYRSMPRGKGSDRMGTHYGLRHIWGWDPSPRWLRSAG